MHNTDSNNYKITVINNIIITTLFTRRETHFRFIYRFIISLEDFLFCF